MCWCACGGDEEEAEEGAFDGLLNVVCHASVYSLYLCLWVVYVEV